MIGYFVFDGRCSKDFGLYISGGETFGAPKRDVTKIAIPGKNGELIIDNGRFENKIINYPAFIRTKFKDYAKEAREWLCSRSGYFKLIDSYNPEYYRMASFLGPLDFDTRVLNRSGECTISFDCKPERYLLSGDTIVTVNGSVYLYNPTPFTAFPLIRVYGKNGNVLIGDTIVNISLIDEYVDLDCEMQNAFKGTVNCNKNVSNKFPTLPMGKTGVTFEGNITKLEIRPRWWSV